LVYEELHDGYKHIDLALPKAKINIEVDGVHHLTNPQQILADLHRGYYSHKNGYHTMHIQNEMIRLHLKDIAQALSEASRIIDKKLHIYTD
jgi:very-short-patch-repair endonuclease